MLSQSRKERARVGEAGDHYKVPYGSLLLEAKHSKTSGASSKQGILLWSQERGRVLRHGRPRADKRRRVGVLIKPRLLKGFSQVPQVSVRTRARQPPPRAPQACDLEAQSYRGVDMGGESSGLQRLRRPPRRGVLLRRRPQDPRTHEARSERAMRTQD